MSCNLEEKHLKSTYWINKILETIFNEIVHIGKQKKKTDFCVTENMSL